MQAGQLVFALLGSLQLRLQALLLLLQGMKGIQLLLIMLLLLAKLLC